MCYHIKILILEEKEKDEFPNSIFGDDYTLDRQMLAEQHAKDFYHASGFDHPKIPVITQEQPNAVQYYEWGLIPRWAQNREKAAGLQNFTLNATCENVFDKPSFKDSIYKQRCIILATGFYENRHEGKLKYPYFIYPATGKVLLMGGLTSEWADRETGEIIQTCTIITTPANGLMEKIHNTKKRMPLVFTEEQAKKWLQPGLSREEIEVLMSPCSEEMLRSHTISRLINQSRQRDTNVEGISDPVIYPELALLDS